VNIRSSWVNAEAVHYGILDEEIAQLKERLPDKGKWTVLVPLQQDKNGRWFGQAMNKKNEKVILEYDRLTGLTVTTKEG
jgi:CRISPR-associated endonuclease/helicase Cas3